MLVSIFENAYKLEFKQKIGNNIFFSHPIGEVVALCFAQFAETSFQDLYFGADKNKGF